MTLIPPVDGSSLNAISERSCVIMYSRWTAFGCGLGCVLLCHLLCARRGFYGIRIVAVTGCRELIIWQRVTSCMCSQIRIEKQICISVLSTIILYRLGICVGGISGCYSHLKNLFTETISLECAGIGHVQGLRRVPSCEHDEKCGECNIDDDHDKGIEGVWTFVMGGKAPDAVVAGSLTFDDLAYFWRWHKAGEIIKSDELADGQSSYGVISDTHDRTALWCIITALYHTLIMLHVNVESTSQPCLAMCWVLGVIGTALLVLVIPMPYVLHSQSRVYHPWSSKSSTCGDDIGREAVLQESFASITYFYSRLIVSFRLHSIPWTCVLIGQL